MYVLPAALGFDSIPHFHAVTTAVFSTCGMNIWVFMLAAFLSLPKQFITVYLGVALEDSENGKPGALAVSSELI